MESCSLRALCVVHEIGYRIKICHGDQVLAVYHYGAEEMKPFIHPLCTPSGKVVSLLEPSDHVWHRALWFSHKFVNGINYWDPHPPDAFGKTITKGCPYVEAKEKSVSISSRLLYVPISGEAALEEERDITIHAPEEADAYIIDWNGIFRPIGQEVVFRQHTYGGLSLRTPRQFGEWGSGLTGQYASGKIINSLGKEGFQGTNWSPADWIAISGGIDGAMGAKAGVALFDHPSNLRHPIPWHTCTFGFVGTDFLKEGDINLKPRETLNLRYRVVVFDGEADFKRISNWYKQYSEELI